MNTEERYKLEQAFFAATESLGSVAELRSQIENNNRTTVSMTSYMEDKLYELQSAIEKLRSDFEVLSRQVDSLAAKELL